MSRFATLCLICGCAVGPPGPGRGNTYTEAALRALFAGPPIPVDNVSLSGEVVTGVSSVFTRPVSHARLLLDRGGLSPIVLTMDSHGCFLLRTPLDPGTYDLSLDADDMQAEAKIVIDCHRAPKVHLVAAARQSTTTGLAALGPAPARKPFAATPRSMLDLQLEEVLIPFYSRPLGNGFTRGEESSVEP